MVKQSSPWFDALPDQRHWPSLTEGVSADVVVIGAGMVGVSAAWHLAKAGKSVVVLEKQHVAGGDSGFTTAFLTRVPDCSLSEYVQQAGRKKLTELLQTTAQAQTELFQLIRTEKINCDLVDGPSHIVSFSEHDSALEAEWRALKAVDTRATRLIGPPAQQLGGGSKQAIRINGEGSFDARKFLHGLLQTPTGQRIQVFEESAVTGYTIKPEGVTVTTKQGSVQADRAIVATGWPLAQCQVFRQPLKAQLTYAIAAEHTGSAPTPTGQLWDTDNPYFYVRRWGDKSLIVGGADETPGKNASLDRATSKLALYVQHHWPGDWQLTHRWSGTIFSSPDGLPIIDFDLVSDHRVVVATGLSGNGMVMGFMAGRLAAMAVQQLPVPQLKLFALKRFHSATAKPALVTASPFWGFGFVFVYIMLALLPGKVFFAERGGVAFLQSGFTFQELSDALFPLAGLYAFYLLWVQVMLGSLMPWLRPRIRWILAFHRTHGLFVLLFALLHPTLLLIGVGTEKYLAKTFVDESLTAYVWLGQLQLVLLVLTVATAKLRNLGWVSRHWRTIHLLNYAVFVMAWLHSWELGTDVKSGLSWLWYGMAVTVFAGFTLRLRERFQLKRQTQSAPEPTVPVASPTDDFVTVANVGDVKENQPFCAVVNGKKVMLLRVDNDYFAIDNTCSHAGGPLCEGRLLGKKIECPWHGSQFDVTTGAVITGPAFEPQAKYEVRVQGDSIQLRQT